MTENDKYRMGEGAKPGEDPAWTRLNYAEKNRALYQKQKALLDLFLEKHAISQAQHDKSLRDLTEKMKFSAERAERAEQAERAEREDG